VHLGNCTDFTIDKVYTEVVSGGVEFRKRPIFQKVLSELKSGSKLVVSRLDRLSRKVIDTLKVVEDFKKERKKSVLQILAIFIQMEFLKSLLLYLPHLLKLKEKIFQSE
jgi:DNA invertase Pin-like site-specific DNA recombinase